MPSDSIVTAAVPVGRIAEACGFCNVAYLSNVFRRETGLSPRTWRNRQAATKRKA